MDNNRIHPLQVVALLLFLIGGFFTHAGSDPVCDSNDSGEYVWGQAAWTWEEQTCEPNAWDELGYGFLDATGILKNTANTIGFGLWALAFYCWVHFRQTQKNEEAEKLPEAPTEETTSRSAEEVQQLYENLGLEPTKETDETLPEPEADKNWWED